MEGPFDNLLQFLCKMMARDKDRGLRGVAGLVLVGNAQVARPLPLLLGLVGDCPVDSLSCFPETRRAFDQKSPNLLAVLALEAAGRRTPR